MCSRLRCLRCWLPAPFSLDIARSVLYMPRTVSGAGFARVACSRVQPSGLRCWLQGGMLQGLGCQAGLQQLSRSYAACRHGHRSSSTRLVLAPGRVQLSNWTGMPS